MTIEIHNPELEVILQQHLKAGNFANVEEMLLETFTAAAPSRQSNKLEEQCTAKALEAADRIRELRKGVTLNRPAGMSLREYAHIGHRF